MNPSRTFSHHYNLPPHLQYQLYLFLKSSKTLPNDHLIKWYQFLKKEDNYYFPSLMNITYDPNDNIPRIDYEIIKNMFLFYKNKYLTIQNIHTTVAGTTTLPGQMLTKDGTHTHSLSSILSILWNINLELLLMKLSQNNKMKKIKFPPLKQQFELSLLWFV